MAYTKAIVFISSRNTYEVDGTPLTEVRARLREDVEERFPFLDVRINEDWAARPEDPHEASLEGARSCDLFVGILVADAGFTDEDSLSATHQEFDAAGSRSRRKMLVFAEQRLQQDVVRKGLAPTYQALFEQWTAYRGGRTVKWFETAEELRRHVLEGVEAYCAEALRFAGRSARAESKSEEETAWELMTFTERHRSILDALADHAAEGAIATPAARLDPDDPDAGRYALVVHDPAVQIAVLAAACPERFSYPEAARYVGYPFRTEVEEWEEDRGPLHVVLVYRNVTDTQIRRHLGNPDIHVSRETWGFFAADPERFIQVAYLTRCINSHEVMERVLEFIRWLGAYDQLRQLADRAATRGRILQARR